MMYYVTGYKFLKNNVCLESFLVYADSEKEAFETAIKIAEKKEIDFVPYYVLREDE